MSYVVGDFADIHQMDTKNIKTQNNNLWIVVIITNVDLLNVEEQRSS